MPSATVLDRSLAVLRVIWPGLLLIGIGGAAFASLLDALWDQEDLWAADTPVLEWLVSQRSETLTSVFTVITNTFGPVILPILVAIGALIWARVDRRWWAPSLLVGAMLLAVGISSAVKAIVGRPRPPAEAMSVPGAETTFSFPSGHTIGAATLVLVAGYLIWTIGHRRAVLVVWVVSTVVIVGLVAGSRLYLGYHFVTDVLAGASLAVAVLGVVVCVNRWWGPRSRELRGVPAVDQAA
ncbi:hypothetical protein GCM10011331_02380 [Flavimobilis marinus]|uniref:Undecaprenyl-diphosphatase n=1 Tax=Flavimobilis marinus TaxID=285351 RepID=A0A1I2DVP0_9MICO|nr:phosphatase PAP2 family protein [Flavimobilis marinus]GHG44175.1 hypothetical protein GCM10011331_02380 [Flavimobilis marinus]SFE84742.1 undecaprenyl-diphosphatase [Flavimobilis marinus]